MTNQDRAQKILDNLRRRKGTPEASKMSIGDIMLLKHIANSSNDIQNVSNREAALPELKKFPLKNNNFQVWDTESDTALFQGTNKECNDFIDGFNGC